MSGVNLLTIDRTNEEGTLTITRAQGNKATYPDSYTKKERVWKDKDNIEREMMDEQRETNNTTCTSLCGEFVLRQVL